METWELYLWGSNGGLVAGLLVYVLPELTHAHKTNTPINLETSRVAVVSLLLALLTFISGFAALIPDGVDTIGEAFIYGLVGQSTLKGILSGVRDSASDDL